MVVFKLLKISEKHENIQRPTEVPFQEDDSDLLAAKYGRTYRLVKRSSETTSPESVLPTASDITNSNSKINQNTKCNSPLLKQIMLEVNVFTYC